MFVAGLKFALGLMTGVSLFTSALMLLLGSMELIAGWRKRARRADHERPKTERPAIPQRMGPVILRHSFHTDAWIKKPRRSEYLQ
jgi:hypothetical protein